MSDRGELSPTYLAMTLRKQWSDQHLYEESNHTSACGRCGRRRGHPDHAVREDDRNEVMRWRDRYNELHG